MTVGCQSYQTSCQLQYGHSDNQVLPNIRILFDSNKQSRQITNFNLKLASSLVGIPGEKADSSIILSDYMKISSQNFWQDSGKKSG